MQCHQARTGDAVLTLLRRALGALPLQETGNQHVIVVQSDDDLTSNLNDRDDFNKKAMLAVPRTKKTLLEAMNYK